MTTTITATIERADGATEVKDLSGKFKLMNENVAAKIKEETAKAGKGNVISITETFTIDNESYLSRKYDEVFNEGGEGYEPSLEELKQVFPGQYKIEEKTVEYIK